tara:strand:- start:132 stop:1058 length:927 start_codon:yes stop_codon:yes gene_type:complete
MTQEAVTDLPGFPKCIKLDCTTADAGDDVSAAERLFIQTKFEGQDLQGIKKGTSEAEAITVSFYAKANASFKYVVSLFDADNSRYAGSTFDVTSSWQRFIVTFPADTDDGSSPFDNDNADSLNLRFFIHAGSNYTSGTLSSTFANVSNANTYDSDADSFYSSTDNNFFLTGVQMEVGSVATPFEHRSFGEELALCQRYYQQYGFNSGTNGRVLGAGNGGDTMLSTFGLLDQMRTGPTANYFGAGTDGANFNVYVHDTTTAGAAPSAFATDGRQIFWNFAGNGSYPNSAYWIDMGTGSTQFAFTLDSEL